MNIFRNPDFRKYVVFCCAVAVPAVIVSFVLNMRFGWMMLAVCGVLLLASYVFTRNRYRRISELSSDIDRLLHGEVVVPIESYCEGELSILQSEIHKMTVRLRDQQQRLSDDKLFLADSLADISHQIRTPLTSINLLVSMLCDPDIGAERRMELAHELYKLLGRIDWLITALLKLSQLDAGTVKLKSEKTSLAELVQKSVAPLLVPMELKNQALSVSADGEFFGDVAWTCEAITNVVKNCMEHTPSGGNIGITATENTLYSEIIIADDGSGIAAEDLPHIFERFYKGKDSDDTSFGIGLALARVIIFSQNGTIKAENNISSGAKFTIRFYKTTV